MKFAIIVGSNRENRVTNRQALWMQNLAKDVAGEHEWELVDLEEFDLPMMREPLPPMAGKRPELSEGTKRYLDAMGAADGFIIVTPEYNHGMPGVLKNAIDLLDYQLIKKPVAIVSHGVVGGARANEQVRLVINSNLGGIPVPAIHTFFGRVDELISEDGVLADGQEVNENAAHGVVESLVWYAAALTAARDQ